MKLAVSGVGFLLVSLLLATPAAAAPPGASATATAHALAELANCRAQHRPDCPTDTPTPALTATPRLTELPSPTDTPAPASTDTPASTPSDPPLPVPNTDQATPAYVRPTPRDPSGTWLELAVPQGRWAVLYDTSLCAAPVPWTNVWLAVDEQSNRPITVDRDDGGMCAVAAWSWSSDVPCGVDGQGTCDVEMDGAYWDAIAQAEPAATDTPVPVPIDTQAPPSPAPSATPGAQAPRAGIAQAPRAPAAVGAGGLRGGDAAADGGAVVAGDGGAAHAYGHAGSSGGSVTDWGCDGDGDTHHGADRAERGGGCHQHASGYGHLGGGGFGRC